MLGPDQDCRLRPATCRRSSRVTAGCHSRRLRSADGSPRPALRRRLARELRSFSCPASCPTCPRAARPRRRHRVHRPSVGATGTTVGEVVFNTALTGYQEILSDPSYCRQIVTLTYPHIGSYGVNADDWKPMRVHAAGLVIKDLPRRASNFRGDRQLGDFLRARHGRHRRHRHAPADAAAAQRGARTAASWRSRRTRR